MKTTPEIHPRIDQKSLERLPKITPRNLTVFCRCPKIIPGPKWPKMVPKWTPKVMTCTHSRAVWWSAAKLAVSLESDCCPEHRCWGAVTLKRFGTFPPTPPNGSRVTAVQHRSSDEQFTLERFGMFPPTPPNGSRVRAVQHRCSDEQSSFL